MLHQIEGDIESFEACENLEQLILMECPKVDCDGLAALKHALKNCDIRAVQTLQDP